MSTKEVFDMVFIGIGRPVKFPAGLKTVGGNTSTKYRYGYISAIHDDSVGVLVVKEDGFSTVRHHERVWIGDLKPWHPRKKY